MNPSSYKQLFLLETDSKSVEMSTRYVLLFAVVMSFCVVYFFSLSDTTTYYSKWTIYNVIYSWLHIFSEVRILVLNEWFHIKKSKALDSINLVKIYQWSVYYFDMKHEMFSCPNIYVSTMLFKGWHFFSLKNCLHGIHRLAFLSAISIFSSKQKGSRKRSRW